MPTGVEGIFQTEWANAELRLTESPVSSSLVTSLVSPTFTLSMLLLLPLVLIGWTHVVSLSETALADRQRLIRTFRDFGENAPKTESLASRLRDLNPTQRPGSTDSYERFAKGLWRVSYAPHIRAIERVSGTKFDVFYALEKGVLESYVRFEASLLGRAILKGHLCASGSYASLSDEETTMTWDRIWCDLDSFERGPSSAGEVTRHIAPGLVQSLGKLAFIQSVSRFPVYYLDDDLVMFEFTLLGTKIVAAKVNSRSISEQRAYIASL